MKKKKSTFPFHSIPSVAPCCATTVSGLVCQKLWFSACFGLYHVNANPIKGNDGEKFIVRAARWRKLLKMCIVYVYGVLHILSLFFFLWIERYPQLSPYPTANVCSTKSLSTHCYGYIYIYIYQIVTDACRLFLLQSFIFMGISHHSSWLLFKIRL